MKKRLLALLLASIMIMGAACTDNGEGSQTTDTTAADTKPATTEETTSPATETTAESVTEVTTSPALESESESETEEQTTESQTTEEVTTEGYVDLSAENTAIIQDTKSYANASSTGEKTIGGAVIDFENGASELYAWHAGHESLECDSCGMIDINSKRAFRLCVNDNKYAGFTVLLESPIPTVALTDIELTFMSSVELTDSAVRLMPAGTTDVGEYVNECPSLSGATSEWRTVSLGVTDMSALADSDGFVRAFKVYFRDKDSSELYINNITLKCDITENFTALEKLATVEYVDANCFYKGGAVQSVAQTVADRFSAIGIAADITMRVTRYTPNSAVKDGSLAYKATITVNDRRYTLNGLEAKISRVENCYLEISDGPYGAERNSFDQWKDSFDCGGILTLTDNLLKSADGIVAVDYAVISRNAQYTDAAWYAPQALTMSDEGFSHLYINAVLDYGDGLVEGEEYRLVVRGRTTLGNYVIHVDIPFEYSPLSKTAVASLSEAKEKLEAAEFSLDADSSASAANRAAQIKAQAKAIIGDNGVMITPVITFNGVNCAWVNLYLCYTKPIESDRVDNSKSYFAYLGAAYMITDVFVTCASSESSIQHVSPADGEREVNIASDAIIKHMNTDLDMLGSSAYYYENAELCTPPAVKLEWSDKNAAEGKIYNVVLSENADLSDPYLVTTTEALFVEVKNLKAGTRYYWKVSTDGEESAGAGFMTSGAYPRFVDVDGVSNIRDIGGYTTIDGKTVKQGLVYRSAWLDPITAEGKTTVLEQLGVVTDLDLRGESTVSPVDGLNCISTSVKHYHYVFDEPEYLDNMRVAIAAFADEDNYPMIYHCYIGRDRTGTVTALILGLLGVDEDTVKREYMLSLNSTAGHNGTSHAKLYWYMEDFIEGLKAYGGNTFNENVEAFLLEIGVTPEEITSIRNILLEE
ncbi:MAG: tyrosine-protein phosphatase [Clostridia bacterium]|nr:tyrosine-protein phosphatase [Clostridia bacterium]